MNYVINKPSQKYNMHSLHSATVTISYCIREQIVTYGWNSELFFGYFVQWDCCICFIFYVILFFHLLFYFIFHLISMLCYVLIFLSELSNLYNIEITMRKTLLDTSFEIGVYCSNHCNSKEKHFQKSLKQRSSTAKIIIFLSIIWKKLWWISIAIVIEISVQ